MEKEFDEQKALEELKKGYEEAEKLLENEDKLEKFLQRLEKKLKIIPIAGDKLAVVPVMASLLKNYAKKRIYRYSDRDYYCDYKCINVFCISD